MKRIAVLLFSIAMVGLTPSIGQACMGLWGAGQIVAVDGEEALVVWDEASHTEHFVRRASFARVPHDFGFFVPTPTQPTLMEAPDAVFRRLFQIYRSPPPRRDARSRAASSGGIGGLGDDGVEVVDRAFVAGMEGTVLSAASPTALNEWLAANGYQSSPAIAAWLAPYVTGGWFITAFRIDPQGRASMHTHSVCMSFTTDRAFFPYSEPAHTARPRPFRVSVVAPHRMDAVLGSAPWRVRAGYANHPARLMTALRGAIPESVTLADPWLTTFDERRSIRGADDLYFVPAAEDRRVASRIDTEIMARAH